MISNLESTLRSSFLNKKSKTNKVDRNSYQMESGIKLKDEERNPIVNQEEDEIVNSEEEKDEKLEEDSVPVETNLKTTATVTTITDNDDEKDKNLNDQETASNNSKKSNSKNEKQRNASSNDGSKQNITLLNDTFQRSNNNNKNRNSNNDPNSPNTPYTKTKFKQGIKYVIRRMNSAFLLVVLPLFLAVCILLRVTFQSTIHLFLLLLLPLLYPVNKQTTKHGLRNFNIIIIIVSILALVGQLTFQIVLLSNPPYGNPQILANCSVKQEILEEFGFSRFDTAIIYDIMRIILPDFFLLIVAICSFFLCCKVNSYNELERREFEESAINDLTLNQSRAAKNVIAALSDSVAAITNETVEIYHSASEGATSFSRHSSISNANNLKYYFNSFNYSYSTF
jgi:hypothetical protein